MSRAFVLLFFAAAMTVAVPSAQTPTTARPSAYGAMLTVDSIMRGPRLVGYPPRDVRWAADSSKLYFTWQRPEDARPGTWTVDRNGGGLRRLSDEEARDISDVVPIGAFDRARRRVVAIEKGDIVIVDVATGRRRQLTRTAGAESNPRWARNDTAVTFTRDGNLFLASIDPRDATAALVQLTDIGPPASSTPRATVAPSSSQQIARDEELNLIEHLKRQQEERKADESSRSEIRNAEPIARFQLGPRQTVSALQLSGDESFVWIGIEEKPSGEPRHQDVPNYVTTSAYPEMIPGRANVGDVQIHHRLAVLDLRSGKSVWADESSFAGQERKMPGADTEAARIVDWSMPEVSDDGLRAVIAVRAQDNKDRWLVTLDPATGRATVLDQLHDDAWIHEIPIGDADDESPDIAWLPDNHRFLFLSERTGWMHLYVLDTLPAHPQAAALTSGAWEITDAAMSRDRSTVFLTTNEGDPGQRQLYRLPVSGGSITRLTSATGAHNVSISPDEQLVADVHSYAVSPPDLYLMKLQAGAPLERVTTSPIEEWRAFKWIDPKIVTYRARDGAHVYARLFTPEMIGAKRDPKRPAVVFVHGAGYLQEAHKYWSANYYRENMFNNILASRGYVVLSPDYRASAGYGRDWRTAIYRHMGGKDLEDVVDGARFLIESERVDPKRLGVYGGSYGGFITLMAMFTTPDVFAAGAALRPVTDWLHYNHGYTSNILNVPQNDLDAYRRSSPIYFADGLKGRLLLLHGMVDTNVFFQDTVRLVQRLIELRKENWAVSPYPVENHTFTEETSWADEYRRILTMFEETLRR